MKKKRSFFRTLRRSLRMRSNRRRFHFRFQQKALHPDFQQTALHPDSRMLRKSLVGLKSFLIKSPKKTNILLDSQDTTFYHIFLKKGILTYSHPQLLIYTLLNPFLLKLLTTSLQLGVGSPTQNTKFYNSSSQKPS
jgi:hypothetical protein